MAKAQGSQLKLPNQLPNPATMDPEERLFRHKLKPDWGVGLWVREERNRRRFRFEDGEMRAFRKGYYEMLEPVDGTRIDVDDVFQRIASEHEILAREAREQKPAKPPVMTFDEQVLVFKELFPAGFQDPDYVDAHRKPLEGSSTRKSHVDLSIDAVQEKLAEPWLKSAIEEGRGSEVHEVLTDLLKGTSVVTPSKLKLVANLDAEHHLELAQALYKLLHSEERYRDRFENWLRTLRQLSGKDVNWPLVTAIPALMDPERHVALKARVFQLQGRELAPSERLKKTPTRRGYRKGRRIALATDKALKEAGLKPKDMFDVAYFIWETLRPKGRKLLEKIKETA